MAKQKGGRGRYEEDLSSALAISIPNVSNVHKINGDGEIDFTFSHSLLSTEIKIRLVPQELSSYPWENFFLAFTETEVPPCLTKPLDEFLMSSIGMKVGPALEKLSESCSAALRKDASDLDDSQDAIMTDVDDAEDDGNDFQEDDDACDEDFEGLDYSYDEDPFGLEHRHADRDAISSAKVPHLTQQRIKRDFRVVRAAGFKVSRLCGFDRATDYSIMSISVRVDKLNLSDETCRAWGNLRAFDWIVLLIRYEGHYTTFEDALSRPSSLSKLQFCLRKCNKYKPTIHQALEAFSTRDRNRTIYLADNSQDARAGGDSVLELLPIGESIDHFMTADFISMLKLKHKEKLSWDIAKKRLSDLSSRLHADQETEGHISKKRQKKIEHAKADEDQKADNEKLPAFICRDHMSSSDETSLPLVAAQFAMRYLLRCTDYCMVCHQPVEGNFEALKPYVCSNPLCLFQYMNIGFGPSIEHEIINQPNVVDLLISFCYAGLQGRQGTVGVGSIREFPNGLHVLAPNISSDDALPPDQPNAVVKVPGGLLIDPVDIAFDWDESTVLVSGNPNVKEGEWICIVQSFGGLQSLATTIVHHARIEGIIGQKLNVQVTSRHTLPVSQADINALRESKDLCETLRTRMVLYGQNLDDVVDQSQKIFSTTMLIATIPSIKSMLSYLAAGHDRRLSRWNGLSPSAEKLLRWVIASNRSYIVQVGSCPSDDHPQMPQGLARQDEQISGVDGWIQFRFAQGSPEKEIRFQRELKKVEKPQRTILAWHGSPLSNWHSIIRQGLNFAETLHGRAYGNGVYFGRDFGTSLIYTGSHNMLSPTTTTASSSCWPNSALEITAAISLNEIVNKPQDFVSSHPYYVVQYTHWIQCRYLFVRPSNIPESRNTKPSQFASLLRSKPKFIQDALYEVKGPYNTSISVPRLAIPSAQIDQSKKSLASASQDATGHTGDSGDEDDEDMEFLLSEDEDEDKDDSRTTLHTTKDSLATSERPMPMPDHIQLSDHTDFRPGTLDLDTLPKLSPPAYATPQAQKTLGREVAKLQKVQSSNMHRLHELGWYINFDKITNLFHWIIELHSFDPDLPLSKDMRRAGLSSIILEIRFGKDFPMSPPFVRVVRPRFLPFMNGGGGHVTGGGAMCMELLTNSGWSPASSLESVFLQVRMAICSTDPKPARLQTTTWGQQDYGIDEAFEAYTRAAATHGWSVPEDLKEATTSMRDESAASSP